MPIEFHCLTCQKLLRVPDTSAGKMARCPGCGEVQAVPSAAASENEVVKEAASPPNATPEAGPTNPFSDRATLPTGNPFGDSTNPYAVTTSSSTGVVWQPLPVEYARSRVEVPAITLAVLAGIALGFTALGLVINIFAAVANDGAGMDGLVFQLLGVVVGGMVHGVVFVGALQMRKLKNYSLSVAAAVLAMLPCSGCCIIGLPVGIWALVVLSDRSVRAAFQ